MSDVSYLDKVISRNPEKRKEIENFLVRFLLVDDILVDSEIFKHTFRCTAPGCGECCYAGTVVKISEIERVSRIVEGLKPYLSTSKVRRLNRLDNCFHTEYYLDGYFKLRTWGGSCIFLMEDKKCAVHAYCLDNGIDWIKFHFDLCVTYPLRILTEVGLMQIEEELYSGEYVYPCFQKKSDKEIDYDRDLVYYMRDIITDRLGSDFWVSLEKKYVEFLNV